MNTPNKGIAAPNQLNPSFEWSNFIINTPLVYSLLEKRLLYYVTFLIKKKFNTKAPKTWEDLYFHLTNSELGELCGGEKNVPQTYKSLIDISKKLITITSKTKQGELRIGKVHWIDSFFFNLSTKTYDVRVSPEILPYILHPTQFFTTLQLQTALQLKSKFTQKFYELCCEYGGEFRYKHNSEKPFKKNVLPLSIDVFRNLFNLNEIKDERTGKLITKAKYPNFKDINTRIIQPAIQELYSLYYTQQSSVWCDCIPYEKKGRKVISLLLFIYTKDNPKKGLSRPWQTGDEPLSPYDDHYSKNNTTKIKTLKVADYSTLPLDHLLHIIYLKISQYLKATEALYYLQYLSQPQYKNQDNYLQVLSVITEKEKQEKFQKGTKAYQRKSITDFVLSQNLKEYGWFIPPPQHKYSQNSVQTLF